MAFVSLLLQLGMLAWEKKKQKNDLMVTACKTAAVIFDGDLEFWDNVFDLHDSTQPTRDAY